MHRCVPTCWGSQKLGHHVNKSQHRWMWTVLLPFKESGGKQVQGVLSDRHVFGCKVPKFAGDCYRRGNMGHRKSNEKQVHLTKTEIFAMAKVRKEKGHGIGNGAKESEPCSAEMEPSRVVETH